ncbi:zinc finger protein 271 [Teleopsis dalmanni]|uniref:zinc finger protein 271 n=1 Tax=Teleopsis dalmanni TaxID=139649 RepID=UPI000D32BAD8|nr:zinc finger protein 271 [Teleopsis dalmanni]XP_037958334.1 zinc finger protein 271 [Teleopsis dalmanni]
MSNNYASRTDLDMSIDFCRICFSRDDTMVDIFLEPESDDDNKNMGPFIQWMEVIFQFRFEKKEYMPSLICQACIVKIKSYANFRQQIINNELKLKRRARNIDLLLNYDMTKRDGLNDNPGTFVLGPNEHIIEVNPDQEDSTDDEFSMESDIETTTEQTGEQTLTPFNGGVPQHIAETNTEANGVATVIQNELLLQSFSPKNTFLCQFCDMAFTATEDCAQHELTHNPDAPFSCNFCPFSSQNRQMLITHIRESHDSERPYICAQCSKGFGRRSDLKKHTIVHTGVRPFTCHICGKNFSRNTNLTKHMRIHSSVRPYVCQRCPRSFPSTGELVRHTRTHAQIKPYKCNRCTASFTRKDKLVLHERVHNRRNANNLVNHDTRYQNSFTNGQLNQPLVMTNPDASAPSQYSTVEAKAELIHTNEIAASGSKSLQSMPTLPISSELSSPTTTVNQKPVQRSSLRNLSCTICDRSFTREFDLNRHMALHLDSLYKCTYCASSFSRPEKLALHIVECQANNNACEKCNIKFSSRCLLESHRERHERQESHEKAANPSALTDENNAIVSSTVADLPSTEVNMDVKRYEGAPSSVTPNQNGYIKNNEVGKPFFNQVINLGFYSETKPEEAAAE